MNSDKISRPSWSRSPLRLAAATLFGLGAITFLAACGDDEDEPAPTTSPTSAATTPAGSTTSPTTGTTTTPAATNTRPASSPTSNPTSPTDPDGTVAPQNPGDTNSKDVKSNPDPITGVAIVTDLRLGYHDEEGGWERIVFEFEGDLRPSATIEYVDEGVAQCGSGEEVEVEGDAILSVTLFDAQAHTPQGQATLDFQEVSTPPGGETILEGIQICDFEGQVQWVFGLTGEQNFKVTTLEDASRIVIDIKQ